MKFLFFTLIFLTNKCWSQDVILNDQFKKVISEVNNEFKSLKGNFKNVSDNGDSVFHSHVFLEGTINSEIEKNHDSKSWSFICTIDSANLKSSKKTIQEWMMKLKSSLSKEYKINHINEKYANGGGAKGYNFINGNIKIIIFYSILTESKAFSKSYLIISTKDGNN
ncbi:MAG: hypothetical protein IPH34_15865 [Chitinophagaceae bacterium]|jgi:hypothetical protein|nr:hypothetical protein [Chitinophagaceae bacterium]MBP6477496.1 hypothetical protein [Chitinophagaceae bacterium]MBP7107003.1 hypothetical protein [Chitinophagaceae bacterium]MBP7314693.1 hypothetical protein [Chitinophagaceae bacterium]HQX97604.1 hypothetical protein [Chitinophagaceae bacterium]